MNVVVFLPGILGSELRTANDEKVWPPTVSEAIGELKDWKIKALLDETPLAAPVVVEQVCLKTVYRGFLQDLEASGFSRTSGDARLVVMPYDWRLNLVEVTAPDIADRLDRLMDEGAKRFHLVSHSMGGLVARLLVQDPRYAGRAWRRHIVQSITMASPFRGAPVALARLLGMEKVSGIPGWAFEMLRKKPSLCAPYQLLPPPGVPMVWTVRGSQIATRDLYGDFGRESGFLAGSLAANRAMHDILVLPWPTDVSAFQFAGTGFTTATRLAVAGDVRKVEDENSGDQTVPLTSAAGSGLPTMILPGEHVDIMNNTKLRRTVRALLGVGGDAAIFAAGDDPETDGAQVLRLSAPTVGIVSRGGHTRFEVLTTLEHPLSANARLQVTATPLTPGGQADLGRMGLAREIAMADGAADLVFRLDADLAPGVYELQARLPDGTTGETRVLVEAE